MVLQAPPKKTRTVPLSARSRPLSPYALCGTDMVYLLGHVPYLPTRLRNDTAGRVLGYCFFCTEIGYGATALFVPRSGMVLCLFFGTEIGYAATALFVLRSGMLLWPYSYSDRVWCYAFFLYRDRVWCYGLIRTEIGYGAMALFVLRSGMVLWPFLYRDRVWCYGLLRTEIGYAAMALFVLRS
eukprot:251035-Rhodomonas_salina.1